MVVTAVRASGNKDQKWRYQNGVSEENEQDSVWGRREWGEEGEVLMGSSSGRCR